MITGADHNRKNHRCGRRKGQLRLINWTLSKFNYNYIVTFCIHICIYIYIYICINIFTYEFELYILMFVVSSTFSFAAARRASKTTGFGGSSSTIDACRFKRQPTQSATNLQEHPLVDRTEHRNRVVFRWPGRDHTRKGHTRVRVCIKYTK